MCSASATMDKDCECVKMELQSRCTTVGPKEDSGNGSDRNDRANRVSVSNLVTCMHGRPVGEVKSGGVFPCRYARKRRCSLG